MAAVLGYDVGYTLWVQCDRCGEQLMAFGQATEARPELEAMIRAEGWRHLGGNGWLCLRCAGATPSRAAQTEQCVAPEPAA